MKKLCEFKMLVGGPSQILVWDSRLPDQQRIFTKMKHF